MPLSLLADDFSKPVREFLLDDHSLLRIEAFPQKDDPNRRVFFEAKLSTCVFLARKHKKATTLIVRTHPAADFEANSPTYQTLAPELRSVFRRHIVVPTISQEEWITLQRTFGRIDWPSLVNVADIYVGEVFDNSLNHHFLSDQPIGPIVLRGAHLDRYLLREQATQGENKYLREKLFTSEKAGTDKSEFRKYERIGLQRGAAVDNWRRLIAAIIPAGRFSFDTVLLIRPRSIDLHVLLGIVNSDLWEWRFRCTSTTNHVNEYELSDLVIPPKLVDSMSPESQRLQKVVKQLLQSLPSEVRRSECQTVSDDSIDMRIEELVFRAYEVKADDQKTIIDSLRQDLIHRQVLTEDVE